MSMKSSWRFSFVDVDASVVAKTAVQDEVLGYCVVRAPKGSKKAVYFGAGNEEAIKAYIGTPSANWPDLYEAIDFNKKFPLYISAPAGSSKKYPSYLGGKYFVKSGEFEDFSNVGSKEEIDFTATKTFNDPDVNVVYKNDFVSLSDLNNSDNMAIYINMSAQDFTNLDQIQFDYFGCSKFGIDEGTYYYSVDKKNMKVYCQDKNFDDIKEVYAGIVVKNGTSYRIFLGGSSWLHDQQPDLFKDTENEDLLNSFMNNNVFCSSTNTSEFDEIPFLSANDALNNLEYLLAAKYTQESDIDLVNAIWTKVTNTIAYNAAISDDDLKEKAESFFDKIFTVGSGDDVENYKVEKFETYKYNEDNAFKYLVNIKNNVMFNIYQRNPTEGTTEIEITDIGYDKYLYDECYPIVYKTGEFSAKKLAAEIYSNTLVSKFSDGQIVLIVADGYEQDKTEKDAEWNFVALKVDSKKAKTKMVASKVFEDVTELLTTKRTLIKNIYSFSAATDETQTLTQISACPMFAGKIVEVLDTKKLGNCSSDENAKRKLVKDITYNTITFKAIEDVDGQKIVDGPFTGSFNPLGVDSYGNNIFFPNVVLSSDLHLVDIDVVNEKGFDDDINPDTGVYNPDNRLVSDIIPDIPSSYKFKLKGQRYITKTVQDNIDSSIVGGVYRDDQESAIMQGWNEFKSVDYDPVYIAFDPTGVENVQSEFVALRASKTGQQFCTMLSNRRLSAKEAQEPNIIVVKGRSEGCAQLINEVKFYDNQTGKYFYRTLTGPYASACATIMRNKLGGAAPACMNYDGMGGQLEYTGTALEAKWEFSEDNLKNLDTKGLNAITFDPSEGVMVTSQKTTLDPTNTSDRSYLAHTMSFDICKRNIRDLVMVPQLMKPIDEEWMNLRETQTQSILNKRLAGPTKIWAEALCRVNDPKINNAQTMSERIFNIDVKVKVIPFSEFVNLTFTNVAQETSVTED